MEHDFWHRRWASNEIGFHQPEANPLLARHLPALQLAAGARIFLPLCGKTLDIGWLLARGYRVVGAELSELAVQQLFAELGVVPQVSRHGALGCYQAPGLDIFVGDIFALDAATLGAVDALYDRAALVALPMPLRARYAAHLQQLGGRAPQLLISFEYDQSQLPGPPFAVPAEQLEAFYAAHYRLQLLERQALAGGLKGQCAADELVWLLQPR